MKKVFKVSRVSEVDYDEYDSCVIVADDIDEVNNMINRENEARKDFYSFEREENFYWDKGIEDRIIEEINLNECESMELCASFNAG